MKSETISRPFIKSPFLSDLISLFDSLRYKKEHYGMASCVLLTGESGSGKSELAKNYVKNNPVVENSERTTIPVLHYELRSIATPEEFLRSLLVAIGDPQQGRGARNKGELYSRLVLLISTVRLELLILDEIQVIIERRSAKVVTGIADLFKDLINDTNIPIVFIGMPWSRYLVDSNQQLKRRIAYRYVMQPYRVSHKQGRDDYRRLLKLLGNYYGMSHAFKVEKIPFALRCFAATSGNLSATANLICDAFMLSDMEGREINEDLFAEVVSRYGVEDHSNAFKQPLEDLVLRELVVNSDWNFGARANKNSIVDAEYMEYGIKEDSKIYCLTG